MMSDCGYFWF